MVEHEIWWHLPDPRVKIYPLHNKFVGLLTRKTGWMRLGAPASSGARSSTSIKCLQRFTHYYRPAGKQSLFYIASNSDCINRTLKTTATLLVITQTALQGYLKKDCLERIAAPRDNWLPRRSCLSLLFFFFVKLDIAVSAEVLEEHSHHRSAFCFSWRSERG